MTELSKTWSITDDELNKCLDACYAALEQARLVHWWEIQALEKAAEAADLALECRQAEQRFARKQLLFQERI